MLFRLVKPLPFLIEKDCVYCEVEAEYINALIENHVYWFYIKGEYWLFHCCVSYIRYTRYSGKYASVGIAVSTCN